MIDLFAGTGAFTYAFEKTGKVDVVFANDIEESSKIMYNNNFNHKLTLKDIHKLDVKKIPKHNILTSGISCQSWSIAGKRKGFDDERSDVFWKVIDIISYHQPDCIIIENVKNLLTHDNGNSFKTIKNAIKKEGYYIKYKILNTSTITKIPQHRERIYIVCFKNKKIYENFNFDFPDVKKNKITTMLEDNVDSKYYYNNEDSKIHQMIMDEVTKTNTVYQFRRIYVRENKNNECPTLTANMGTGGHNVPIILDDIGARKLTPRECFNFQGFPKNYKLSDLSNCKLYKLAGNAVSISVVKLLADKIVDLLYDDEFSSGSDSD